MSPLLNKYCRFRLYVPWGNEAQQVKFVDCRKSKHERQAALKQGKCHS